jgi:FMN reductase
MYLVVSCSLNPASNSRLLARAAVEMLEQDGHRVELLDLRDAGLPLCDGEACYALESVQRVSHQVRQAAGVLIATPIYNYDANAAAKNLIELTGRAWQDKVVGFLCAAGGKSSYMSIMALANSLMLDFRCLILPRFVYATDEAFRDDAVHDSVVRDRLHELTRLLVRVSSALN